MLENKKHSQPGSQWQLGLSYLHELIEGQLQPNIVSISAAMSACEGGRERGGWGAAALWQFESRNIVELWLFMICYWHWNLKLLGSMAHYCSLKCIKAKSSKTRSFKTRGRCTKLKAISILFFLPLNCSGSQWPRSLWLFSQLSSQSQVDEIALGAAISACEEGGQWQLAMHYLSQWAPPYGSSE